MEQQLSLPLPPGRRRGRALLAALGGLLLLAGAAYVALVQLDYMPNPIPREPAPHPTPAATRDGRWRQDVAYLASQLEALHRDAFFRTPARAFRAQAAELEARVPASDDASIMLGMAALAASIGDGHTQVELYDPERLRTLPLRAAWYGYDLVIIGARADYRQALGARITHIGDTPVEAALKALEPAIARDNDQQLRGASAALLLTPELMAALGIIPDADTVTLRLEKAGGEELALAVTPVRTDAEPELLTLYDAGVVAAPPLRLRGGDESYWFTYLPEQRALYFHYRRCVDDPERPFAAFSEELFAFVDANPVERIIVDLRFNGGGNSTVLRPFIEGLRERPRLNQEGQVYVLTGAQTFSSALMNAVELRDRTGALLVGEPTGGRPNGYGEVRSFTLPTSGLKVRYSTRYFRNVPGSDAPSLEPDIAAPITWEDLLAGIDPAVDVALAGLTP